MDRRGITRARDGSVRVALEPEERLLLASLPRQVEAVLEVGDPSATRVFPPAYPDDDEAEGEYRRLVGAGLLDGHREALRALERTAHAETLTEEELEGWLGALETLRLVLGTQLDVGEEIGLAPVDESHPEAVRLSLYQWLSWLQEDAVHALASALP